MKKLYLGLLCVLAACASPHPVFRQLPYEQTGTWYQGREYILEKGSQSQMVIAFERIEGLDMVFDLEVQNISDRTYLLDPRDFYAIALPFEADHAFWDNSEGALAEKNYRWAYDPEEVILDLDTRLARIDADQRNNQTASLITLVAAAGAAVAVAATQSGDNSVSDGEVVDDLDIGPIIITDTDDSERVQGTLAQEKAHWESGVLRKTTLAPGQKIRGKVYFSMLQEARFNYFYFPVGSETLQVVYRQKRMDTPGG